MDAEETSDALAVRLKDLSHILEDQAEMLDPGGSHRADLDALAQWWAVGQRYEPGAPEPTPRRTKGRQARRLRDIPDADGPPSDAYDEPPWRESG